MPAMYISKYIPVDDESSKLLTFNSSNGHYHFSHMPYGIHSASDVCQNRISQLLQIIEGAANSKDDIIIWSETLEELKKQNNFKVFKSIRNSIKRNVYSINLKLFF